MFWAPYLSFCRVSNTLFIIFSGFLVIFPPALLFFNPPHFLTLQRSLSDYIFCTICHPLSSSSYLSHHLLGIGPLCPLYLHAICVSCRSPPFVAWSPCLPRGSLSFAHLFHLIPAFLFRSVSILLSTLIFFLAPPLSICPPNSQDGLKSIRKKELCLDKEADGLSSAIYYKSRHHSNGKLYTFPLLVSYFNICMSYYRQITWTTSAQ